jgi:hypothetical protein
VEKLDELISAHVKERIEIHSSEGELLKHSLLGLLNLDIRSICLGGEIEGKRETGEGKSRRPSKRANNLEWRAKVELARTLVTSLMQERIHTRLLECDSQTLKLDPWHAAEQNSTSAPWP